MDQSWVKMIKACVFDAYGTLFDVHSAVGRYRAQLGNRADQVSALWRTKQLEYTWLRSLMGKHADFWRITQDALDFAFAAFDIKDHSLQRALMEAYLQLDCYPEVPEMLKALKRQGFRIAILSNGSPTMLTAAARHASIQHFIDETLSVEEVGIYKPSPRVYQLAVEKLALKAQEISFQSANAWDVAGAASFGLAVVWINRFGQHAERLESTHNAELTSLAELPPLLSGRTTPPRN